MMRALELMTPENAEIVADLARPGESLSNEIAWAGEGSRGLRARQRS
jgi:hypothetical protein